MIFFPCHMWPHAHSLRSHQSYKIFVIHALKKPQFRVHIYEYNFNEHLMDASPYIYLLLLVFYLQYLYKHTTTNILYSYAAHNLPIIKRLAIFIWIFHKGILLYIYTTNQFIIYLFVFICGGFVMPWRQIIFHISSAPHTCQ